MSLQDWLTNGWLVEHETNTEEIGNLILLADRDLRDAGSSELSVDWRFNIAYNAALQMAGAAMVASGYRTTRTGSHHYRTIRGLVHTIGIDDATVRLLDRFRKKRNMAEYDAAGMISEQEAREMLSLARSLREESAGMAAQNAPGPSEYTRGGD